MVSFISISIWQYPVPGLPAHPQASLLCHGDGSCSLSIAELQFLLSAFRSVGPLSGQSWPPLQSSHQTCFVRSSFSAPIFWISHVPDIHAAALYSPAPYNRQFSHISQASNTAKTITLRVLPSRKGCVCQIWALILTIRNTMSLSFCLFRFRIFYSHYKHRITKAEETVPLLHSLVIRL